MAPARSNYRQVRLTITEEQGGRLTVRVLLKRPQDNWSVRDVIWTHRWRVTAPTPHWVDLLEEVAETVRREMLPPAR